MPQWASFDVDNVMWLAGRIDPLSALDRPWPGPDFSQGQRAIDELFGLGGRHHFLRHHRGLIPRLWETQVTRAFRAMLLETPALTLDRCQALLSALLGSGAPTLAAIDRITADASDRMDLAIHARTVEDVPCCIVVEAKLDSDLSDDQLAKYLKGVAARYPRREQRHLWVVAPTRSPATMAALQRKENREWNFTTWRRLLIDWQIALADDPGHDVLSLFGEVWKRVGGR